MRKAALLGECLKLAPERAITRDDELCAPPVILDDSGGPQKYLESLDRIETAHRADDEVVLIESELLSEFRQIRRHRNPIHVDGVLDARNLIWPETFDEEFAQGEGKRQESINSP